jgi:hypothetical protein
MEELYRNFYGEMREAKFTTDYVDMFILGRVQDLCNLHPRVQYGKLTSLTGKACTTK